MEIHPFDVRTVFPLEWREIELYERVYELRSRHKVFARIEISSPSGSEASVRTASAEWTFRRTGVPVKKVVVRERGSDFDAAIFRPRMLGKGTLLLHGGTCHPWKAAKYLGKTWAFKDERGVALVNFSSGAPPRYLTDLAKIQATVTVADAAHAHGALPLLCCLGFYLMIPEERHSIPAGW